MKYTKCYLALAWELCLRMFWVGFLTGETGPYSVSSFFKIYVYIHVYIYVYIEMEMFNSISGGGVILRSDAHWLRLMAVCFGNLQDVGSAALACALFPFGTFSLLIHDHVGLETRNATSNKALQWIQHPSPPSPLHRTPWTPHPKPKQI